MASLEDKYITAAGLLLEVKTLLAKRSWIDAYQLAARASVRHASDPFLLSYYGYLDASVEGKYRRGIEACTRAITLFEKKMFRGEDDAEESQMAVLYLNLGKAYIAAEKKKEAIKALNAGLKFDRKNQDLMAELERMGIRKLIPVPFLKRTNPVNEIIGWMLRKRKGEENRQHA
jgi:tetratricopeptide (TPR) repeat protein